MDHCVLVGHDRVHLWTLRSIYSAKELFFTGLVFLVVLDVESDLHLLVLPLILDDRERRDPRL